MGKYFQKMAQRKGYINSATNKDEGFQFFLDETENVKLYILNSMGQYVGTLLNEEVGPGIHQFDFTNQPTVWLPEVSLYENHKKLEPGVYVFVLETDKKIKANKFTVVK